MAGDSSLLLTIGHAFRQNFFRFHYLKTMMMIFFLLLTNTPMLHSLLVLLVLAFYLDKLEN
jgi:hypothetical protein